jgi:anti-sigma regulatory factor (Ser/Thr protein kinase)
VCVNAVEHAAGGYYGMWCDADELVCEVVDAGRGMSEPYPGSGPSKVSSQGGYGLGVTRRMCEHVEIKSRPGWTSVRLHVALSRSRLCARGL